MKRENLRNQYAEEYDYLEFVKRTGRINQSDLYCLDEGRRKRHLRLLRKYGYSGDRDEIVYRRSKILMDNLDVMIDMNLNGKVSFEECSRLSDWLGSMEFKEFMEGKREGIRCKGYIYS